MSTAATREVPFFNYRMAFKAQEEEFVSIFRDVLGRGAFIMQRDMFEFEKHVAEYLGVKHVLSVGNATDGLYLIWRAVGLNPGDEVILPSHTMLATPAAVHFAGGVPVPVDIDPADHMLDPEAIEPAITEKTRAICPVQVNGRTCKMDRIMAIAQKHNLIVVEDAAQALGSKFRGQFAGTFGVASAFSFYPAKVLGCLGDGGCVVTNDDAIAHQVHCLRDHGRDAEGEVQMWGMNTRLDNLQAAFLDFQLATYQDIIDRRRALAEVYQARLGDLSEVQLPAAPGAHADHYDVFQNYELEADRRDELKLFLRENGIGTLIQWSGTAVHQFRQLGFTQTLPATERFFQRGLMLPMNIMVSDDDANYVCDVVRRFYGK